MSNNKTLVIRKGWLWPTLSKLKTHKITHLWDTSCKNMRHYIIVVVNQKMEMYYWGGQRSPIGWLCLRLPVSVEGGGGVGALPSLFEGLDDVQAPVSSESNLPFILQLRCQKSMITRSSALNLCTTPRPPPTPPVLEKTGISSCVLSPFLVTWVLTSQGWLRPVRPWWGFEGGCAAAASSSRLVSSAAAGIMQHLRPWRALLLLAVLYQPGTAEKYGKMRRMRTRKLLGIAVIFIKRGLARRLFIQSCF